MEDFKFIREFARISVNDCCKKVNVSMPNIYNRRTSKEKAKMVREEIEDRIARLYLKGKKEDVN